MAILINHLNKLGLALISCTVLTTGYAEDKKITTFGYKLDEDHEEPESNDFQVGYTYSPARNHFVFSRDQEQPAEPEQQEPEAKKTYIKKGDLE